MEALKEEADRIKMSGVLGRSSPLVQLFDYLVDHATDERSPKESELALHVYGKPSDFDASADAVVRVHMHRLRGKIDEFYRTHSVPAAGRLVIPKGEYRLIISPEQAYAATPLRRYHLWRAAALLLGSVLILCLIWIAYVRVDRPNVAAQQSSLWAPYANSNQTTLVVVGDQYAFGVRDSQGQLKQIIRDEEIGSPEELAEYRMLHPEIARQFSNIDAHFLPVGAAGALHSILPVLTGSGSIPNRVRVLPMSQITPDMLRATNVVYIGHLNGLGILGDPAFAGSRFARDWNDNQLVMRGKISAAHGGARESNDQAAESREQGYISTFPGPTGNRITIVSGTSDAGLMQAAESATKASPLDLMLAKAEGSLNFEAVLDVTSLGKLNVGSRLVTVAPLKAELIWREPLPGATE